MERVGNRWMLRALCAFIVALLIVPVVTGAADAKAYQDNGDFRIAGITKAKGSYNLMRYPGKKALNIWDITNNRGGEISQLKSSNPKVVSVKKLYDDSIRYTLKKPGKATVSYKVKGQSKKKTLKITVFNYKKPVKTFICGGKNYAKKFAEEDEYYIGYAASLPAGKVTVKAAKGWKVKSIIGRYDYGASDKKLKNGYVLKKGAKIPTSISVKLVNKKTKNIETVELGVLDGYDYD